MTATFLAANAADACQLKLAESLNPKAVLCYLVYGGIYFFRSSMASDELSETGSFAETRSCAALPYYLTTPISGTIAAVWGTL